MMKRFILTVATSMFMASAGASSIYHGFADGNSDLDSHSTDGTAEVTGVQPGVGDRIDVYGSFGSNPDLFSGLKGTRRGIAAKHPDIYGGFGVGNHDLQ